jgi:hypothetical protein
MGTDPKQLRVLDDVDVTEDHEPRDISRDVAGEQLTTGQARRVLKARREHSKGDGNFPTPEPTAAMDEKNEDRTARDLPKADDDRSSPKGNTPVGQEARNPGLEARDDFRPELDREPSGFEKAERAARAGRPTVTRPVRPTARRSSAAKRDAAKKLTKPSRRPTRASVSAAKAPKVARKNAKGAAVARRPQAGRKRTGTTRRGRAVSQRARGGKPSGRRG